MSGPADAAVPEDTSSVTVERNDRYAVVTLANPGRKNALSSARWVELGAALGELANDPTVGAIVVTGADGAFCSGVDLRARGRHPAPTDPIIGRAMVELGRCGKPTIAAVEGACVAAAWSFALAHDLLVADETAFFEFPFPSRGMHAGAGVLWHFGRQVTSYELARVVFGGVRYDAATALRHGLVNEVVTAGGALARARALADQLASMPVTTTALSKVMLRRAATSNLAHALESDLLELERNNLARSAEDSGRGGHG